jgi:hypothetical protein
MTKVFIKKVLKVEKEKINLVENRKKASLAL